MSDHARPSPLLLVDAGDYVITGPDGSIRMPISETHADDLAELVNRSARPDVTGGSNPDHVPPPFTAGDLIATPIELAPMQRARVQAESERLAFECTTAHKRAAHPFCPSCRSRDLAEASLGHYIAKHGGKPIPDLIEAAAGPSLTSLTNFLAVPDEPASYLVRHLWPAGGNVILAAQFKAGKSTLVGNLTRALVDGTRFLDAYDVTRSCRVALIDDELDERNLRRWLRDQRIENTDRLNIGTLRGQVSTFNILDPVVRSAWAEQLRGHDVIILDCLRPILDALGLSEDKEAGRFLVAFDALVRESGATEALVVHHAGHGSERSRGDSRLLDWPDATWTIVRETDDPSSARFFKAFGRDVDQPESALTYDPDARHLRLERGSRRDAARDRALEAVVALLRSEATGLSGNAIETAMTDTSHPRKAVREGIAEGVRSGQILFELGERRAKIHRLNPDFASSPHFASTSPAKYPASSPPPYRAANSAESSSEQPTSPSGEVNDPFDTVPVVGDENTQET